MKLGSCVSVVQCASMRCQMIRNIVFDRRPLIHTIYLFVDGAQYSAPALHSFRESRVSLCYSILVGQWRLFFWVDDGRREVRLPLYNDCKRCRSVVVSYSEYYVYGNDTRHVNRVWFTFCFLLNECNVKLSLVHLDLIWQCIDFWHTHIAHTWIARLLR